MSNVIGPLEWELAPVFREASVQHWCAVFEQAAVPCGPIQTLADIYEGNAETEALVIVRTVPHPVSGSLQQIAFPVNLSASPAEIQSAPPLHGQHTDEMLRELGYRKEDISASGTKE